MPFKDAEKRKEYKREQYSKNKISEKKSVKNRKLKIRKWFREHRFSLSCSICGENRPATMDFHHKGNKENQIIQMVHWGYSIDKIKKEKAKYQILCTNCHRKLHRKNKNL